MSCWRQKWPGQSKTGVIFCCKVKVANVAVVYCFLVGGIGVGSRECEND